MILCKIKTYFGIFVSPLFCVHMVQYIRMPTGGDMAMKKKYCTKHQSPKESRGWFLRLNYRLVMMSRDLMFRQQLQIYINFTTQKNLARNSSDVTHKERL